MKIMTRHDRSSTPASVPLGTIVAYLLPLENLPDGWLPCDGSVIPSDLYQGLITALGSNYTPNLAGMTLVAAGTPDGNSPCFPNPPPTFTLGTSSGEFQHTLSTDELPSHSHETDSAYGYDIYFQDGSDVHLICVSDGATTQAAGSDQPHNNMQPYHCVNYIICAVG